MAKLNIELQPFTVPNFVAQKAPVGLRQEGFKSVHSYPLRDVDAQTLSDMCDAFRREVFVKALKLDPKAEKKDAT